MTGEWEKAGIRAWLARKSTASTGATWIIFCSQIQYAITASMNWSIVGTYETFVQLDAGDNPVLFAHLSLHKAAVVLARTLRTVGVDGVVFEGFQYQFYFLSIGDLTSSSAY